MVDEFHAEAMILRQNLAENSYEDFFARHKSKIESGLFKLYLAKAAFEAHEHVSTVDRRIEK